MRNFFWCLAFVFSTSLVQAQSLSSRASEFLESLGPDLRSRTVLKFEDPERYNFNFIPLERKGPTFHDFDDTQKQKALNLLRASLGVPGFRKATEIMELEKILIIIEKNSLKMPDGSPMRDPLNYHFLIFGSPSEDSIWGWRFEGHHVSLSFSTNKDEIVASTPSFMGSNPGVVPIAPSKGKEVLKLETALGFELVNSLSEKQLASAIISEESPREILTRNKREISPLSPTGIGFPELTSSQKELFMRLLEVYVSNYQLGFARTLRQKIEDAGHDNLSFAWAGSKARGAGHYYRIQGPMLLIEYANTQNDANHVHTIVRDLTNDFAEDILRRHYENEHK